jgi:murein L,D-transpeptidase YcbB/YkuD
MTQVIFNPTWYAPRKIFASELISYIRIDTNYLSRNKMTILSGTGMETHIIDPDTIDWMSVDVKTSRLRLRQDPGPESILGRVKFVLPNKYEIYLHDTPYRENFEETVRLFSHGCIRLEKPFELAQYLLRDTPGWTSEHVAEVIESAKEQPVTLDSPKPVFVLYQTVWLGMDGSVQFRDDVYETDAQLVAALRKAPVRPPVAGKRLVNGH